MGNISSLDNLDNVLSSIVNNSSNKIPYSSIQKEFNNIPKKEFTEIILKLEKDGLIFIKEMDIMDQKTECIYSTFDGRLLSNSGGYVEQNKREQKSMPLRKLKTELINTAALAAGIYYSFEIVRIYITPVFQHICDCQFVWQK